MKNALAYCRVSGRSQKDGTSLDEQAAQIEAWANAHGYTVIECYRDVVSGEKPWQDRPRALALIERLAHNRIILGDAKTCVDEINRFRSELNVKHLVCRFSVPGIPREACETSLDLFTREVMPALRAETS